MSRFILQCVLDFEMEDGEISFKTDYQYKFYTVPGTEDFYECANDEQGIIHGMYLEHLMSHFKFVEYE